MRNRVSLPKLGLIPRASKEKPGFFDFSLIKPDRVYEKPGFCSKLGVTQRASKEKPGFFEKVRREPYRVSVAPKLL
jgi:hypothetical protein